MTATRPLLKFSLARKVGAEMIGTFAVVFAGCGAIMVDALTAGAVTHVGISLTFGLVVMAMITATGHISGAHFNPAVTLAFAAVGRFPWREVPVYIAGQCVAATAAAFALRAILGDAANLGATLPANSWAQSLAMEFFLTFFLMFVIKAVATDSRAVGQLAGLAIGGTVALEALFAGPICGASMNPARSVGPALVALNLGDVWVYVAGPIAGAMAGAWAYRVVRCEEPTDSPPVAGCC